MDTRPVVATSRETTLSRVQADVETVKAMAGRVEQITERVTRHARALGYYDPPTVGGAGPMPPTPVVTTLADALRDLDRALDHCSGSLNVFD